MRLLRSLILLCCFSFFLLSAGENVRLWSFVAFNYAWFLFSLCRCGETLWCFQESYPSIIGKHVFVFLFRFFLSFNGLSFRSPWQYSTGGLSSGRGSFHRKRQKKEWKVYPERLRTQTPDKKHIDRGNASVWLFKCKNVFLSFPVISHRFHHRDAALCKFSLIQIFHFDLMLLVYNVIFFITHIIKSWED